MVKEKEGKESVAYAAQLAMFGLNLLQRQKWGDAEPVLRECLAIRQGKEPDAWTTFNAQSLLGGALLGQKKHADAEKKVADGQAQAAQKADDCQRARGYIKSLEDGVRLVHTNPDGSRELLDEAQRAAEAQRTREIIETRCN